MPTDATDPAPLPKRDPRVLVVEDEPRLRELLLRVIGGWGFDVSAVRSGEEALRVTSGTDEPPDVVVLDLNLPGMDGMDVLRRLRERLPALQAVILTGFASLEAARQAIHLDVVEFLTKPCHLGELEQALDRAARRLVPVAPPAPPVEPDPPAPQPAGGMTLEEVERRHILDALARNAGNRTATAAELGISRRTLYYKITEYQRQGFAVD